MSHLVVNAKDLVYTNDPTNEPTTHYTEPYSFLRVFYSAFLGLTLNFASKTFVACGHLCYCSKHIIYISSVVCVHLNGEFARFRIFFFIIFFLTSNRFFPFLFLVSSQFSSTHFAFVVVAGSDDRDVHCTMCVCVCWSESVKCVLFLSSVKLLCFTDTEIVAAVCRHVLFVNVPKTAYDHMFELTYIENI